VATIYDVARRAKVSTYTVSAVLNRSANVSPELTERVRTAVKDLDYTVNELARSLPLRRSKTVGMLIPDLANPFYAKVVRGVEDRLRREGYALILGNTYNQVEEQARYVNLFRSKQVDGLVLFAAAGDETELQRIVEAKKPVVFVGRVPKTVHADSVTADNRTGALLATDYLLRKGHRAIAIVSGQLALSTSADRVEGWRAAHARYKVAARNDLIGEGDWTADSGRSLMNGLLDLAKPPTAVFAANFLMMTGILRALRERRLRCPEDVEVISSDDSDWLDVFSPPVSTVISSSYAMGESAADLLLKRMRQPGRKPKSIVIPTELKIRTNGEQP
jgi:DNA-binding LacI/PurR family transcriptional regulator